MAIAYLNKILSDLLQQSIKSEYKAMKTTTKAFVLIVLFLSATDNYSIEWSKGPDLDKEKIIRTAVWERTDHEIVTTNAYLIESSCVNNAANCALDQIRKYTY